MSAAAFALFALSQVILKAPCWSLFIIVAAVAWPIWLGQREFALFQHRLALVATTRETSRVRRWFWRGSVTSTLQMVSALFWAALLLAFVPLLDPWHVGLLAVDVVVLVLAARNARALLEKDVREEYVDLLSRRWVLTAFNVAFLTASFFVIDYFVVGAPDTRGLAWNEVADRAYQEFGAGSGCALAGGIVGLLNAADQLNWHAAEVIIPSLPAAWLRLAAWLVFLLQAGFIALAYTRLQLGVLALAARRAPQPQAQAPKDIVAPVVLAVFAATYLLAAFGLKDFDPSGAGRIGRTVVERINPCRTESTSLQALRTNFAAEIDAARMAEQQLAGKQIDETLDRLFVDVEKGVDRYLDWYFSLIGEYSRLAAWIGSRSADALQAGLEGRLEKRLFANQDIRKVLSETNQQMATHAAMTLIAQADRIAGRLGGEAHTKPCWAEALHLAAIPDIERDVRRASTSLASGVAVGTATAAFLAGRLSRSAASRLAAKRAFPSAAGVATRYTGRRAGLALVVAGAGTAACAPGGPLALLCGIVAGVVTWVAVDEAMIRIDELRFRDEMRREILEATQVQKEELARDLRVAHNTLVDSMAAQVHTSLDKVFIPARDGG